MRRETLAFAQQKWPGDTLYQYGLRELAQRQAVLLCKDKSTNRAIKSDRAKVVMTAGCISITFDISNYIYILREIGNSANQNLTQYYPQIGTGFYLVYILSLFYYISRKSQINGEYARSI